MSEDMTEQYFMDRRERWWRVVDEWGTEEEPLVHLALPTMPLGTVMCGADLSYKIRAAEWYEPPFGEGPLCEGCLAVVTIPL